MASRASQLLSSQGFVVIKRSAFLSVNERRSLVDLNVKILQLFSVLKSSWKYRLWRFFNNVSTAKGRHSIPLPFSNELYSVLDSVIGSPNVKQVLESQLRSNAPMVELSSVISFPGSAQQDIHSDIAFSQYPTTLLTGFLALSNVTVESGPTMLFANTHTREYHSKKVKEPFEAPRHYSSDGTFLENYPPPIPPSATLSTSHSCIDAFNDFSFIDKQMPVLALLDIGDVLLMDAKLFHCGGANVSGDPRALLSFSFQQVHGEDENNSAQKIVGFTYHCDESVTAQNLRLNDFKIVCDEK